MISSLLALSSDLRRSGEIGQDSSRVVASAARATSSAVSDPPRLVLVDLLDEADLALVEPAVGGRHRHHRLEDEVSFGRFFRHVLLLALEIFRPLDADCACERQPFAKPHQKRGFEAAAKAAL